jgi:protocatechuate 3,4-dioxygenase alpha subunit
VIPSASQTAGPFFNFGLTTNPALGVLTREGAQGARIRLSFRVLDGDGLPTPGDSMIELWQADAQGRYAHPEDPRNASADPAFRGFGRLETNQAGECVFESIKPGGVPGPDGTMQAPHINITIFARGLQKQLVTRLYFAGDAGNASDPALSMVPAERRQTLLAHPVPLEPGTGHMDTWHMDIRLQGEAETVFFDV